MSWCNIASSRRFLVEVMLSGFPRNEHKSSILLRECLACPWFFLMTSLAKRFWTADVYGYHHSNILNVANVEMSVRLEGCRSVVSVYGKPFFSTSLTSVSSSTSLNRRVCLDVFECGVLFHNGFVVTLCVLWFHSVRLLTSLHQLWTSFGRSKWNVLFGFLTMSILFN